MEVIARHGVPGCPDYLDLMADQGNGWGMLPTATPIVIREAARAGGYVPIHNRWYDKPRQPDPNP